MHITTDCVTDTASQEDQDTCFKTPQSKTGKRYSKRLIFEDQAD